MAVQPASFRILFQSTFPRGERHELRAVNVNNHTVSIHVPARGTTKDFAVLNVTATFQSTFPRGERPNDKQTQEAYKSFNPRSREGNDFTDRFPVTP